MRRGSAGDLLRAPWRRGLMVWLVLGACGIGGVHQAAGEAELRESTARPSVLLITLDTVRADRLGCYGYRQASTPNLDAIAQSGWLYENAFSVAPLTLPAHASLLTGRYPPAHGVRDNGIFRLAAEIPTVAEIFRAAGYRSAAFVSAAVLEARFGLDRGFQRYDDRLTKPVGRDPAVAERRGPETTRAALDWLERQANAACFLWVHLYDAHDPYEAAPEYAALHPGRPYDGEISWVDHQVGELYRAFRGARARAIVAIVGDHGEALGQHGEPTHGLTLYQETIRVPLVLVPSAAERRRIGAPVSIAGLAATLLRLAGLSAPAGAEPDWLRPAVPRWVYFETWMPLFTHGWAPLRGVSDGRWKWVAAPQAEFYDLESDPLEVRNLALDAPMAREARRQLERFGGAELPPAALAVDAETAQKLRSLGYASAPRTAAPAAALDPKQGLALLSDYQRAQRLALAGEVGAAKALYQAILERSPNSAPVLEQLAYLEQGSGSLQRAAELLERARQLQPTEAGYLLALARVYQQLGHGERARRLVALALELDSKNGEGYLTLARLQAAAEALDDAALTIVAGCERARPHPGLWRERGRLERQRDNLQEAAAAFSTSLELDPAQPDVHNWLAELSLEQGDSGAAIQHYEASLRLDSVQPVVLRAIAALYLASGRRQEAERTLQKLLRYDPGDARAREQLLELQGGAG